MKALQSAMTLMAMRYVQQGVSPDEIEQKATQFAKDGFPLTSECTQKIADLVRQMNTKH